ncbi:MAG: DUF488 domain-containing protein [Bacteroidia bacterium]
MKIIYTIGHSTRSFDEFVKLLNSFKITLLADIRNYPGSKRYPHFNKEALEINLPARGISYLHFKMLGGRRKPLGDSKNNAWRNSAFKGYADYMETDEFQHVIKELEELASHEPTAYMCSEAVWWRCHRALISDFLKIKGWNVRHIIAMDKAPEHPYTSAASIVNGKLSYQKKDGDDQLGISFD